jgi:hypothetical protein
MAPIGTPPVDRTSESSIIISELARRVSCVAQKLPAPLKTATLPTSKADPGGTSLTRNSLSLSAAGSIIAAATDEFVETKSVGPRHFNGAIYWGALCDLTDLAGDIGGGHGLETHRRQANRVAVGS